MTSPTPHYLLFCDGNIPAHGESAASQRGRWRFVLENLATGEKIEASDQEIGCAPDRAALTAVLRGLEALEQPSRVTLVTTSRYVTRGLQYGLTEWRDNDYTWEHFGAVQPIRNADIWKRIDRALAFHQVQCRWMAQEVAADEHEDPGHDSATHASTEMHASETKVHRQTESSSQLAATIAEPTKQTGARHAHKPSGQNGNARAVVSTSKYQRVYVDTPPDVANVSIVDANATESSATSKVSHSESQNTNALRQKATAKSKKFALLSNALPRSIALPLTAILRCPLWLWRSSWAAILTLDEWIESFLRCLLLMDPSQKSTRH